VRSGQHARGQRGAGTIVATDIATDAIEEIKIKKALNKRHCLFETI